MQFKLFGSFCALALYSASVSGAALSQEDRLVIQLYKQTGYRGEGPTIPFKIAQCTKLPAFSTQSVHIPENYHCSFYAKPGRCEGRPDIDTDHSIPDVRRYTPSALVSFSCHPNSTR